MTVMTINGTDISNWNAKLLDFAPAPCPVTNETTAASGTLYPVLLHSTTAPLSLSVTFDVYGRDMADAEMTATRLLREVSSQCEIGGPDDFLYRCILTGASRSRTVDWIVTLSLTFEAVRHKPKVSVRPEAGTGAVYCEGTVETPCILRIGTTAEGPISISGDCWGTFEIQETGRSVIIDGIQKTVRLSNGENCFLQTSLTKFPSLQPGLNTILADNDYTSIIIQYYPTFL